MVVLKVLAGFAVLQLKQFCLLAKTFVLHDGQSQSPIFLVATFLLWKCTAAWGAEAEEKNRAEGWCCRTEGIRLSCEFAVGSNIAIRLRLLNM